MYQNNFLSIVFSSVNQEPEAIAMHSTASVLIGPISYSFCLTNAAWQSLMGFSDAHHGFLSDHFFSPNIWVLSYSDLLPHPSGT